MKLELKHLAPYLPYGLELIFVKSGRIITMQSCLNNGSLIIIDCNEGNNYDLSVWYFKPILRPLSDLYKCVDDDERNVTYFSCISIYSIESKNYYLKDPTRLQYEEFQKLLEWHFDVFGLIDAGLAIDINTIK